MFPVRFTVVAGMTCLLGLPLASHAGGAFLFKIGNMALVNDQQDLDGAARTFDRSSQQAYGAMIEHRSQKSGIGLGAEYLHYRHEYTPPGSPSGIADTRALMFMARKYFLKEGVFHPFIGFGIGVGRTDVDHGGLTPYNDREYTTTGQLVGGVEFRFDHMSIMVEARHSYHDIEGGGNEYNPTATGVTAGFGFNW